MPLAKRKKIFLKRISILIFSLLLIYTIVYQSIGLIVHSKKEVIVPNIENKPIAEALSIVSELGLGLKKIGETYNPNFPVGTVVLQQPQAGMTVRKGKLIGVIISLGGEKVFVPNVVGEDRRKAEVILRQYGVAIGTITESYSLKYSKNKIISQSYPEGSVVDKNTQIDLKISLGLPPQDIILMPDFVNKNISEVQSWVENYGIKLKLNYKLIEQITQENIVIEQNPPPDTVLNPTDEVEITLSKTTSTLNTSQQEYWKSYNFEYGLPFMGNLPKNVKIVQISDEGEYVLYNKLTNPKEKILLYVPPRKNSRLRIFVDGVLIDEK